MSIESLKDHLRQKHYFVASISGREYTDETFKEMEPEKPYGEDDFIYELVEDHRMNHSNPDTYSKVDHDHSWMRSYID